jgi:hypothetical protein
MAALRLQRGLDTTTTLTELRKPYRSAENAAVVYRQSPQCDVRHTTPPFSCKSLDDEQ